MRDLINLLESKSIPEQIEIIHPNYSENALSPVMSASLFRLHWGKLAHDYANRYNTNVGDPKFNWNGATLHNIFFTQFRSPRSKNVPNGPINNLIQSKYESWDDFKNKFIDVALTLQGSGWVYLARDGTIKTIRNHDMRNDIVILVDLFEHAWITDYGANKKKYLENIWRIFDWNVINSRYMAPYRNK